LHCSNTFRNKHRTFANTGTAKTNSGVVQHRKAVAQVVIRWLRKISRDAQTIAISYLRLIDGKSGQACALPMQSTFLYNNVHVNKLLH